jgi:hypothetical protein
LINWKKNEIFNYIINQMKKKSLLLLSPLVVTMLLAYNPPNSRGGSIAAQVNVSETALFQENIYPVVIPKGDLIALLNHTPERKAIRLKLKKNNSGQWVLKAWGATQKGGKKGSAKVLNIFSPGNIEPYVAAYDKTHELHFITRGEIRAALGIAAGTGPIDPALITDGIILTPCRKGTELRYYISRLANGARECTTLTLADPGTSNPSPPGFDCGTQCDDPDFN